MDTGAYPPIFYRKPMYGPHIEYIIMEQISSLLDNSWISKCEGSWGSQIVLAIKPHQEHIDNIKKLHMENVCFLPGSKKSDKKYMNSCDMTITIFPDGAVKNLNNHSGRKAGLPSSYGPCV